MKKSWMVFFSLLIMSGCSFPALGGSGCPPDTIIEWIDTVKINDISYAALEPGNYQVTEGDKGEVLGRVDYTMAETACSDHRMRNGDAAYLTVGTQIFEFKGYASDFRVIAGETVYEVFENEAANTIGDLYDIEGKVRGMSIRSSYDGSHVMDLKEVHAERFIEEYLSLEYVGFDKIYNKISNEEGMFLVIHLEDGSSIRTTYWPEANAVNPGAFGNETLREIISLYE